MMAADDEPRPAPMGMRFTRCRCSGGIYGRRGVCIVCVPGGGVVGASDKCSNLVTGQRARATRPLSPTRPC